MIGVERARPFGRATEDYCAEASATSHPRERLLVPLAAVALFVGLGSGAASADDDPALIEEGRILFMEETFDGNGRTCGTCHPPENNFTVDPQFVAKLKGDDPLFIGTFGELKGLEIKRFLKEGLFLENLDGFDRAPVFRAVSHNLAMSTSLTPDPRIDAGVHALGWSADGGDTDGSMETFAIGAIRQHFPKTLNRVPGVDFRLPTERELAALKAFQLSLGRQADVDLDTIAFSDPNASAGEELFKESNTTNGRACNQCHHNAGANTDPDFLSDDQGHAFNGNFDTGTSAVPNAPPCILGFEAAADGGFGRETSTTSTRREMCGKGPTTGSKGMVTFWGDRTMNTPPLIEAADTGPFFHGNIANTLEDAVRHYTTSAFEDSAAGEAAGGAFQLSDTEVDQIAAFLRAMNVLENIRSGNDYASRALAQPALDRADELVELAIAETADAIEVLTGGPFVLFPEALPLLEMARALEDLASTPTSLDTAMLDGAIALKETARELMLE